MSYLYYLMMHIRRRFFCTEQLLPLFLWPEEENLWTRFYSDSPFVVTLNSGKEKGYFNYIYIFFFWLSTSVIPHSANRQVLTVRKFSVYTKWATSFVYPTRYSIILSGRVTSPCGNWGIWQGPAKDSETWLLPTRRAGSVASAKSSLSSLKRKLKTSKSPSAMLRGVRCFW